MGSPLKSKLMSMYFPNRLELSLRFVLALPKASNTQLDFSRMFFTLQQGWMDGKGSRIRLQRSHHRIFFHSHFSEEFNDSSDALWWQIWADVDDISNPIGKSAGSCQQCSSEEANALCFKDQTPPWNQHQKFSFYIHLNSETNFLNCFSSNFQKFIPGRFKSVSAESQSLFFAPKFLLQDRERHFAIQNHVSLEGHGIHSLHSTWCSSPPKFQAICPRKSNLESFRLAKISKIIESCH